jgi:hypothetical protein
MDVRVVKVKFSATEEKEGSAKSWRRARKQAEDAPEFLSRCPSSASRRPTSQLASSS